MPGNLACKDSKANRNEPGSFGKEKEGGERERERFF